MSFMYDFMTLALNELGVPVLRLQGHNFGGPGGAHYHERTQGSVSVGKLFLPFLTIEIFSHHFVIGNGTG